MVSTLPPAEAADGRRFVENPPLASLSRVLHGPYSRYPYAVWRLWFSRTAVTALGHPERVAVEYEPHTRFLLVTPGAAGRRLSASYGGSGNVSVGGLLGPLRLRVQSGRLDYFVALGDGRFAVGPLRLVDS